MNTSEQTYKKYADARAVKSPILKTAYGLFVREALYVLSDICLKCCICTLAFPKIIQQ